MDGNYDERDWGTGMRMLAGAVATARRLQNLESGGLEMENRLLERMVKMRELEGPSPREKFAFEQNKEAWNRRTEQAKYVISAFTELAKTASEADGKVLEEHASRFMNLLTTQEQEAVGMIWSQSRLNPNNKKGEWFDQSAGGPPKVTADPSKDIYGYAVQMKGLKEYQRRKQGFMTGQVPPEEKLFGLAEGIFSYTTDEGKQQVLSSADLKIDQISKQYGVTAGELVASGGVIEGKEKEISVNGNVYKTRGRFNAIESKRLPDAVIPVKTGGKNGPGDDKLLDFAVAYANQDDSAKGDGSKMFNMVRAWQDQGKPNTDIAQMLKYYYPGYNFAFVDRGTYSAWPIWGGYSPGDTEAMIYWKGDLTGVMTKDGAELGYYYDHNAPAVYDNKGRIVSRDWFAWKEEIGSMTEAEVIAKALGKKAKEAVTSEGRAVTPTRATTPERLITREGQDDLRRKAEFDAQTEKIKANINAALEVLAKLGTGPGIPRVR